MRYWRLFAQLALTLSAVPACNARTSSISDAGTRARHAASDASALQGAATSPRVVPEKAPVAGQKVAIPAGEMRAGSITGTRFRDPRSEADGVPIALPAFAIDVLPYPNVPGAAPQSRVTRGEAEALCAARGDRLCSELEWERACESREGRTFPWPDAEQSAACAASPEACITSEGAIGLGLWGREWTSSEARVGVGDALKTALVRGAAREASVRQHRCDARDAATPDSRSDALTFRCCSGPASEVAYPDEAIAVPLVSEPITRDAARAVLARLPKLSHLSANFTPFSDGDVQRALASVRAARTSLLPWRAVSGLLRWAPVPRERVEVLAGDTPEGAALIVYYPDVDGAPVLIHTYETRGEHAPIVVAARPDNNKELLFSTCWGCGGEGGALLFADDATVRLDLR